MVGGQHPPPPFKRIPLQAGGALPAESPAAQVGREWLCPPIGPCMPFDHGAQSHWFATRRGCLWGEWRTINNTGLPPIHRLSQQSPASPNSEVEITGEMDLGPADSTAPLASGPRVTAPPPPPPPLNPLPDRSSYGTAGGSNLGKFLNVASHATHPSPPYLTAAGMRGGGRGVP